MHERAIHYHRLRPFPAPYGRRSIALWRRHHHRQGGSPHLLLDKIKGELYYAFAETDQAVPAHIPGELKQALDKVDAKYELRVFSGTHHGFCFPERAVYHTLAAEETWTKIFAMWDRCLK